MTHLDIELKKLKEDMNEMFHMVLSQLEKAKEALLKLDKDLAREVIVTEKRVNSFELKLDRDCENIIALFNPVAVDLRFILANLKINSNLERMGDIADGISKFVIDMNYGLEKGLLESTRLVEMYDTANSMLADVMIAYENENTQLARSVFKKDEILDEINAKATAIISDFVCEHNNRIHQSLYALSTIRKLERTGDQCKNIAEEIIFYIEAKVLKHSLKKDKQAE